MSLINELFANALIAGLVFLPLLPAWIKRQLKRPTGPRREAISHG